ncbi:MAG: SurA N-terminal domain-containing protein [Pseudomonadota bacterium]
MLTALRKLAGTWFAKLLFVLLIGSFAIWGIEDVVRNFGRDSALARVDGQPIPIEEAQAASRREITRITRQLGPSFQGNEEIRKALAAQAVEGLVMDRVLRSEASRLGVVVPDAAVTSAVFAIPQFQGVDGRFSRDVLFNFLRTNDLTEQQFLTLMRADLARQQIAGAVRGGAIAPSAMAEPLTRFLQERRTADVARFPTAAAAAPAEPTEAQLRRFHENNGAQFSTPALREAVVAMLTAEMLAPEVQVADADIGAAYEARRAQFETPERRVLQQVLLRDQAAALLIAEQWRAGAEWAAIEAAATAAQGQAVALPETDRAGLPLPSLAEAAFALEQGAVSAPVQSPFGWHVFRAERITPGSTRPLAEVRDTLRLELATEKALDLAFERATRYEDQLAGGATLEEVARDNRLAYAVVRTDAQGRDIAGAEVTLPVRPVQRAETLRLIFAANAGDAARLNEAVDGFIGIELREIISPALKPYESVEAEVREAWRLDAQKRAQEEAATAMLTALRAGTPFAEAAAAANATAGRVGPFGREPGRDSPVPAELLAPLFELAAGEATMAATRDGYAVGQVVTITVPDLTAEAEALTRMRTEVQRSIADDLEAQFQTALRTRATVRVNQTLLESLGR